MDIHITNKTNKSWEVVYIIEKVKQLFSKHRVSKIVSSVWWRAVQTEKNEVCCVLCLHYFERFVSKIKVCFECDVRA